MKLKVLCLFALTFLLGQICFAQGTVTQGTTPTDDPQRSYLIGPSDVISIKVLGEKDFDVDAVTVDEDGKIQIPYSDGIKAQCLTEKGLRNEVVKIYSRFIKNPQVSVYVKERNSRPPVSLTGEIKAPQRIILTRKATLQDVLSLSGGRTDQASGMIQITRTQPLVCSEGTDDDWKTLPSRLYSYDSLKETNPIIYPGDIVDVQKASPIYVVGEVMKPGELAIPANGLPLTQAIAMASGTSREAKKKEVKVYRRKQGSAQPEVITVNLEEIKAGKQKDFMLEPFDIVEIGKSKKSVFDIVLDIATGGARNLANFPVTRL